MDKKYSISIEELLNRPILHFQYDEEWMNKMTEDEILQYELEARAISIQEEIQDKSQSLEILLRQKYRDRTIIYNLLKKII